MPELPTRKRILRKFRIDEISSVDRPAQEGARALFFKRAPDDGSGDEVRQGLLEEGRRLRAQGGGPDVDEVHGWLPEAGRKLRSEAGADADATLDAELERIARAGAQPGESPAAAFARLARTGSNEQFSRLLRLRMA